MPTTPPAKSIAGPHEREKMLTERRALCLVTADELGQRVRDLQDAQHAHDIAGDVDAADRLAGDIWQLQTERAAAANRAERISEALFAVNQQRQRLDTEAARKHHLAASAAAVTARDTAITAAMGHLNAVRAILPEAKAHNSEAAKHAEYAHALHRTIRTYDVGHDQATAEHPMFFWTDGTWQDYLNAHPEWAAVLGETHTGAGWSDATVGTQR